MHQQTLSTDPFTTFGSTKPPKKPNKYGHHFHLPTQCCLKRCGFRKVCYLFLQIFDFFLTIRQTNFQLTKPTEKDVVTTDGGRFDVNIPERCRTAVYWLAEKSEVRRCSWFYKGPDCRLIPYEEDVAQQLEDVYRDASNTGKWQREITLSTGEVVAFKGHNNMVHYLKTQSTETNWNAGVVSGSFHTKYQLSIQFKHSIKMYRFL